MSSAVAPAPVATPDLRLLFVSPDTGARDALHAILSPTDWKLRVASTVREALALLSCEPVPIILCERELSDGSWTTLIHEIQSGQPAPKIIVCSAQVDTLLFGEVLNRGGYDLLSKPFDAREVLGNISLAWQAWNSDQHSSHGFGRSGLSKVASITSRRLGA